MSDYVYSITSISKFGTNYNDKQRPRAYVFFFINIQALGIGI